MTKFLDHLGIGALCILGTMLVIALALLPYAIITTVIIVTLHLLGVL